MTDSAWRCVRASVAGTSHLATDKRCQDANALLLTKDLFGEEILILVASDGAGSADKSDEGSLTVCREFMKIAQGYFADGGTIAQLNSEVLDLWANGIHEAIRKKALSTDFVPRDFACTFLALIVGHNSAIAAQIGDGAIVVGSNGTYETVIWPQSGQYVNATYFITDDSFISNLHTITLIDKPIDEVAVFTDGIQMLALHYATRTVFEPFFHPMLSALRKQPPGERHDLNNSLAEYLDSPLIRERTDDDKTLVLATRYQG